MRIVDMNTVDDCLAAIIAIESDSGNWMGDRLKKKAQDKINAIWRKIDKLEG